MLSGELVHLAEHWQHRSVCMDVLGARKRRAPLLDLRRPGLCVCEGVSAASRLYHRVSGTTITSLGACYIHVLIFCYII